MGSDPAAFASLQLPGTARTLTIPKVTVASFAVYSVMGGIGYGLSHFGHKGTAKLGTGLIVAAFVGAGYALSSAIVQNVAPDYLGQAPPRKEP